MSSKKENIGFGKVDTVAKSSLTTYRKLAMKMHHTPAFKFIDILRNCGRDRTVQRESVWRSIPGKQSSYMSAVAHGFSSTTLFHLVNLVETINNLQPMASRYGNPRDIQFIDHMQSFIDQGYTHIHIDGGNRSDTLIDWYDNKVCLEPGNYIINVNGDDVIVALCKTNYYTRENLIAEGGDFLLLSDSIDNQLFLFIEYKDLTRDERSDLFRKLNDNENLNAEELRNCSTADICGWIRDMNDLYKETFCLSNDKISFVTKSNTLRYKFCAYLASLANYYAAGVSTSNDPWQSKVLDEEYSPNSITEQKFPEFKEFFEGIFIPFVRDYLMEYGTNFGAGGKGRNRLIDLYILLVDVYKSGGELARDSKRKLNYDAFFQTYKELIKPFWSDTTAKYETSANGQTNMCTFVDLYGANTYYKMKHRKAFLDNVVMPVMQERGIFVKKDPVRYAPQEWRIPLWSQQDQKCALTGEIIPFEWVEDGEKTHMDHIKAHAKGGQTIFENMQLVLADANLEKSDS
jgi:hypothetical protein